MATFQFTDQSGATYETDAPDETTAMTLFGHLGGGQSPSGGAPPDANLTNPFNRIQTPGQPDTSAPIPPPGLDRMGELRAMLGGPVTDRMVSAWQTNAPESLGGKPTTLSDLVTGGNDYASNLAANRADTAAAQQAHPADAMAGNVAGAIPYAMLAPEGVAGATGAGAVSWAANSPDWSDYKATLVDALKGGALGAGLGVAGKAIGAGLGYFAPVAVDASVPTLETIGPIKNAAYKAADDLGVAYKPEAIQSLADKINSDAAAAHINPLVHPKAAGTIGTINSVAEAGQPLTLTQLDQLRQVVGRDLGKGADDAERFFGNQIRGNIDNFIQSAGPEAMASGSGPEAAAAIQNARKLNTIYAKSQALDEQMQHAMDMTGKAGSGANIDNWTRTALQRAQDQQGGWTPDEAALLRQGIRGNTGQNALRTVGKLAPTGLTGNLEALSAIGALASGHPAAGIGAAGLAGTGYAAKAAADAMTRGNYNNVMGAVMRGGTAAPQLPPFNLSPLAAALAAYGPNVRR